MNEYSDKSSSQIVRELENSRERLHSKLDRLNHQFQPDQLWETAKAAVSDSGGSEFARNLGRSVRDNPLPVALVGAGIAWMIVGQGGKDKTEARKFAATPEYPRYPTTTEPVSRPVSYSTDSHRDDDSKGDSVLDRVRETGQQVGHSIASATDTARDHLSSATENARDRLSSAADTARERLSDAQTRSQQAMADASDKINHSYNANPLVFGLGVATAAAIIGMLLPATRREDEMLGSYADQARDEVRKVADTAIEKATDIAEKTVETVRDEAEKRGYSADTAEATASKAVDDARDIAKEAAKTVQQEIKTAGDTGGADDTRADSKGATQASGYGNGSA